MNLSRQTGVRSARTQYRPMWLIGALGVITSGCQFLAPIVNPVPAPLIWFQYAGDGTPGFIDGPGKSARFKSPGAMTFDSRGNLIVADAGNEAIRMVSPEGLVTTVAGDGTAGYRDGPAKQSRFWAILDVTVDNHDNIYVSDGGNKCIRKITPNGEVSTLVDFKTVLVTDPELCSQISSVSLIPWENGSTPAYGLAVGPDDAVYATPYRWNALVKISPAGKVTVVAGGKYKTWWDTGPNSPFNHPDGKGSEAKFATLTGSMTFDENGVAYILDNQTVRKVTPDGTVTTLASHYNPPVQEQSGVAAVATFNGLHDIAYDGYGWFVLLSGTARGMSIEGRVTSFDEFPGGDAKSDGAGYYSGVAIAPSGPVYLAEGCRIRQLGVKIP